MQSISDLEKSQLRFEIYFKNKKPIILNEQLYIFKQIFTNISIKDKYLNFQNVKGFDVNSLDQYYKDQNRIYLNFYKSSLERKIFKDL